MPEHFAQRVSELVSAGKNTEAVKLFFIKGMGIPPVFVALMRLLMPGWAKMVKMAHTIPYDLAILEGTQSGKPLPPAHWTSVRVSTLVMVGSKSERFFHTGAKALADNLVNAEYRTLKGAGHGAVMMVSNALATAIGEFFLCQVNTQLKLHLRD